MKIQLEQAQEIAREWAAFMEIDQGIFSVQVGSFDSMALTTDAHTALAEMPAGSHAYGVTVGNPDNTAFGFAYKGRAAHKIDSLPIKSELQPHATIVVQLSGRERQW